jgi:hypothetical protein
MRAAIAAVVLTAVFGSGLVLGQSTEPGFDLPPGMSAIAIDTAAGGAVKSVKRGDHVDVWVSYQVSDTQGQQTEMILHDVVVLAVAKAQTEASGQELSSITLAVKTEKKELIAAANRAAALRLTVLERMVDDVARDVALQYLKERYPTVAPSRFECQYILAGGKEEMTVIFADRGSRKGPVGEKGEAARFASQYVHTGGGGNEEMTVRFLADGDSRKQSASETKSVDESVWITYGTHYIVRLRMDGELVGIQQEERGDGFLKITPSEDNLWERPDGGFRRIPRYLDLSR